MLILIDKDFYVNPAHVISAEIINHTDGSISILFKLTPNSDGKGFRRVEVTSIEEAHRLIELFQ